MSISCVSPKLWRGPRPSDLLPLEIRSIATIISLQEGWDEIFLHKLYAEDEAARIASIELIHVRLSDIWAPSAAQVKLCLQHILSAKGRVYIHCKHGVDRTGFICAAYRVIQQGWSIEQAILEWRAMGFHRWFYFWWESAFRRVIKELERS